MPISRYDRLFGGPGSAQKALDSMKRTYGRTGGERVFYGTVEKRKHQRRKARKRWLQGS
jgi:hypothetical protein